MRLRRLVVTRSSLRLIGRLVNSHYLRDLGQGAAVDEVRCQQESLFCLECREFRRCRCLDSCIRRRSRRIAGRKLLALFNLCFQAGLALGAAILIDVFLRHHRAQPAGQRSASLVVMQLGDAHLARITEPIQLSVERVGQQRGPRLRRAQSCKPLRTSERDSGSGKFPTLARCRRRTPAPAPVLPVAATASAASVSLSGPRAANTSASIVVSPATSMPNSAAPLSSKRPAAYACTAAEAARPEPRAGGGGHLCESYQFACKKDIGPAFLFQRRKSLWRSTMNHRVLASLAFLLSSGNRGRHGHRRTIRCMFSRLSRTATSLSSPL